MSGTDLSFPFVDLQRRLHPGRLNRLARTGRRTPRVPERKSIINEVTGWVLRAQDAGGGQGMAGSYHLQTGWSAVSHEATSSAIPTLLRLVTRSPENSIRERAVLLGISLAEECAGRANQPSVRNSSDNFHTMALAIPAWLNLYRQTRDDSFKTAAHRAGQSLAQLENDNQVVAAPTLVHLAQMTRALGRLARGYPDACYQHAADSLGDAVTRSITADGYPSELTNGRGTDSALARISEVLYAMLEAGMAAGNQSWADAAERGARRLYESYCAKGTLAGRYGPGWRPDYSFHCMTGCARTALIWLRLYQHGFPREYFEAATRLNDFVASTVDISNPDPGLRGGIRAGYPLWIDYYPMSYRTLAATSALDSWMLQDTLGEPRGSKRKLHIKRKSSSENG